MSTENRIPAKTGSDGDSASADSKSPNEYDAKRGDVTAEELHANDREDEVEDSVASLGSRRALVGWLILCYSVSTFHFYHLRVSQLIVAF